jgi:hypothetical protein
MAEEGPRGEGRPADPLGDAAHIMPTAADEARGEAPTPEAGGKDPAAVALGRKGGRARAAAMTPERRAEVARKAAAKRWGGRG